MPLIDCMPGGELRSCPRVQSVAAEPGCMPRTLSTGSLEDHSDRIRERRLPMGRRFPIKPSQPRSSLPSRGEALADRAAHRDERGSPGCLLAHGAGVVQTTGSVTTESGVRLWRTAATKRSAKAAVIQVGFSAPYRTPALRPARPDRPRARSAPRHRATCSESETGSKWLPLRTRLLPSRLPRAEI